MELRDAAATFILSGARAPHEEQEELLLEYVDPDGKLELADIDKVRWRDVAERVLREALPRAAPNLSPQMLARLWMQKKSERTQKRKREEETRAVDERRRAEEKVLRANPEQLPGCVPLETRARAVQLVQDTALSWGAKVSLAEFERMTGASEDVPGGAILELTTPDAMRFYVRLHDYDAIDVADDQVNLSTHDHSLVRASVATLRLCASAPPLQHVQFRVYGSREHVNSDAFDEAFYADMVTRMPMLSVGLMLSDTVRVQELRDRDNRRVFTASLPPVGEEWDISFEFVPESPDLVGCHACGLQNVRGGEAHYGALCDAHLTCRVCGELATHQTRETTPAYYCGAACQLIEGRGKRKEPEPELSALETLLERPGGADAALDMVRHLSVVDLDRFCRASPRVRAWCEHKQVWRTYLGARAQEWRAVLQPVADKVGAPLNWKWVALVDYVMGMARAVLEKEVNENTVLPLINTQLAFITPSREIIRVKIGLDFTIDDWTDEISVFPELRYEYRDMSTPRLKLQIMQMILWWTSLDHVIGSIVTRKPDLDEMARVIYHFLAFGMAIWSVSSFNQTQNIPYPLRAQIKP